MIHIFYLASGNSRRFLGKNKLLIDFFGKPLFCHGLDALINVVNIRNDCQIVVVSRYEEILRYAEKNFVKAVCSEKSVNGISYSIVDGIKAVGEVAETDFMMFCVADQPFLREETIEELLAELTCSTDILSLCHEDMLGNPKIFSGKLVSELNNLTGDEGGKSILCNRDVKKVQVASSLELVDIDRADYLSNITNIFITGRIKVGKSTLIRKVMGNYSHDGFLTLPDKVFNTGKTYTMKDIKTGYSEKISEHKEGVFYPVESTFENLGVNILEEAIKSKGKYVVLDEIGRFERRCTKFLSALEQVFDSKKIVVAVLKKENLPHIEKYRKRNDSLLLDLDKMSFLDAEKQLIFLLNSIV